MMGRHHTAIPVRHRALTALVCIVSFLPATACAESGDPPTTTAPADGFSYGAYARVLTQYVDERGAVDYTSLSEQRDDLDAFVRDVANLAEDDYAQWDVDEQLAFWINAYNALTLQVIVDHYPIDERTDKRLPANSIRQIPGVWDKLKFTVMGRSLTLNDIEHHTIRAEFAEPRIHFALVCASVGCPALRAEPFVGGRLNDQLHEETARFLGDRDKFRLDRGSGQVHLSSIFKWYGPDFVDADQVKPGSMPDGPTMKRAIMKFIAAHLEPDDAADLNKQDYRITWLDYDWSLNEQPKR